MNEQAQKILDALIAKPDLFNAVWDHMHLHPKIPTPDSLAYVAEGEKNGEAVWFASFDLEALEKKAFQWLCDSPGMHGIRLGPAAQRPCPSEYHLTLSFEGEVITGFGPCPWPTSTPSTPAVLPPHPVSPQPPTAPLAEDDPRSSPTGPLYAWVVQCIEHEFGQRDSGWTIYLNQDDAKEACKKLEGNSEQCFTYHGPHYRNISRNVLGRLMRANGKLSGKGESMPGLGVIGEEYLGASNG